MDTHALTREMVLLKAIGVETDEITFDLPITDSDRAEIDVILDAHGIDRQRPLITINKAGAGPR